MDKAGLSPADFGIAARALTHTHVRRVSLHVLDLADGSHLRSLTPNILDGQIMGDTTQAPSRMLDVRFLDHGNALGFVPDDPSAAPLHRSRMLRVVDSRFIPDLSDWVSWTVFTGPVWDFHRDGGEVSVTAHGLERQALGQVWETHEFKPKSKITDAIRQLLAAVGDVNANVPDLHHTFPHHVMIHPMDSAWPHIRHMAASLDRFAMYDGAGRFHLRPHIRRPVYTFNRALLDHVTVERASDKIVNTVVVLGPNPKGPKGKPRGEAILDGPLSPGNLGRNGVPLHLVERHDRQHLKTHKQAKAIASRILREKAQVTTGLSFPSLPMPFLEEHDMVTVVDDALGSSRMRMSQWSLPLGGSAAGGSAGAEMTVGAVKRTVKARLKT